MSRARENMLRSQTLAMVVLAILTLSLASQVSVNANETPTAANSSSVSTPYADYALSALSATDRVTLSSLNAWTGSNLNLASLKGFINHNLVPYGIRRVLLDIGWQNFTVGTIPYEPWVDTWLTACDGIGVQNVLYVGQLTEEGVGSPWVKSVIAADPSARTYLANGSAVAYLSYDSPDVATFLEKDLLTIYSYYGSHPSWVGIGTGTSANDPYYPNNQVVPEMGYSNLSISSFVNSAYYAADVNSTGYLPNGALDPLWAAYRNITPSIVMSSGVWMTSSAVNVYGQGASTPSFVEMRFRLMTSVTSLSLSWYGSKIGSPGPMVVQIFPDLAGSLVESKLLGSFSFSSSHFSSNIGWQSGPLVSLNLTEGYYWVVFSSPGSDGSNYYQVYMKDYLVNDGTASAQEGYIGPGFLRGSTILWAKDQTGDTVALYPYQQALVSAPTTQTFTAKSSFSFNTVFLFLSDRVYNPSNGTITVEDISAGNKVIATGVLSQELVHGLENWVPITLNETVTASSGHRYLISITEPGSGYSWTTVLRGVTTDPPSAGFQGQGSSLLFELADASWGQGHFDFGGIGNNGADAVTTGYMDAVRFTPSRNESLDSVQVLMSSSTTSGNYTSGTFTVSIWNSSASGSSPSLPSLQQIAVSASEVPANGWLNVTGFDQSVTAGHYYWIVFSADSNESFSISRMTSTYAFDVLVSSDGGIHWGQPREGPTEFAFVVSLSNQQLGNFISGNPTIQIAASGYYAQPFYSDKTTQVDGVFIGPLKPGPALSVSINLNSGVNTPSLTPVASGTYNAGDITLDYGPEFVQFSSVANLQAGQKYWIVIKPLNGSYSVSPMVYLPNAPEVPQNLSAMVSGDGGFSWTNVSNSTSLLPYELASPVVALPQLNTTEVHRYLSTYHSPLTSNGTIRGWTGYVAASELSLFGQVTSWLNAAAGRNFTFLGQGQANVLSQLPAKDFVVFPPTASASSCSSLAKQLTAHFPVDGTQYYNVADSNLLASCTGSLGGLLQQLGYMVGTGQSFGQSSPTKVLVVGDTVSDNLTRFLSVAYDATYAQLSLDPTLTAEGNLSQYRVIVWTAAESPLASSCVSAVEDFVRAGGTLVTTRFGGNNAELQSLASILPSSEAALPLPDTSYITSLTAHTTFAGLSINATSDEIHLQSSNLSIILHNYGNGKFYLIWFSEVELTQSSQPIVLLSNAIAESASLPAPIWYGTTPPDGSVEYNVIRTGSGALLVWLTNEGQQDATFSLNLNGSYYGVGSNWKELNMNDLSVTRGTGSNVEVSGDLAPSSWLPVYIVPDSTASLIDYSNAVVSQQLVYPHQSLYRIAGTGGQPLLLLITTNATASQLIVNDSQVVPGKGSLSALSQASGGWVYLNGTDTLLVKYVTSGTSMLRLLSYVPPTPVPKAFPIRDFLFIFVTLVCAELVLLVFLAFGRRRSGKLVRVGQYEKRLGKGEPQAYGLFAPNWTGGALGSADSTCVPVSP